MAWKLIFTLTLFTISRVTFAELSKYCSESLAENGIDLSSFPLSVAHGIHSLTIEQLNEIFGLYVSTNNKTSL